MAGDRNAFDDFFGDDSAEDVVDTRADGRLVRVPLGRIAVNQVNPRTNFGTTQELEELGKSLKRRQIQALPVVTRQAYLKLWPEHEAHVGTLDVVIVSGERRYRAATTVGLPALDCVINDDVAKDRQSFMDAVVSENIDRENFDPIEEALAVEALVTVFGTGRAVAQHYERVDGWVSQRRVLLELAPAVQDLVRSRAMALEPARRLGKLTRDQKWDESKQLAWWEQEQGDRQTQAEERKANRKSSAGRAKQVTSAAAQPEGSAATRSAAEVPHPRADAEPAVAPGPDDAGDWIHIAKIKRIDWSNPEKVATVIIKEMGGELREALIDWLIAAREPMPAETQVEQ
ncbi:ParB/RepB/Spo0J family partition protein [Streptomyces sp. NPDC048340]|uniref:ParB/RepB/Spo0J family partition protein n=1 Tax=Streptomyces sp. NPDC048340 TaxID=3365537 RepID=UPI0037220736